MVRKRLSDASDSTVIQLHLWEALEVAEAVPETADLADIWASFELALQPLTVRSQLGLAGEVIDRLAQIIHDRALLTIADLQQVSNSEGPIMPPGAFDRFVRQSMQVNFAQFVEAPLVPPRLASKSNDSTLLEAEQSVVATLETSVLIAALETEGVLVDEVPVTYEQAYEQALALAHSENVQEWIQAIQQYFAEQPHCPIPFTELAAARVWTNEDMHELRGMWTKTWLALLLGEYQLEQRGEFYQPETIWVTQYDLE